MVIEGDDKVIVALLLEFPKTVASDVFTKHVSVSL